MCNKNSPCFKCELRTATCHSYCMKYKSWKQEKEEMKKEQYNAGNEYYKSKYGEASRKLRKGSKAYNKFFRRRYF